MRYIIEVLGIPDSLRGEDSSCNHILENLMRTIVERLEETLKKKNSVCIFFPRDHVQSGLGQELFIRTTSTRTKVNREEMARVSLSIREEIKFFALAHLKQCRKLICHCGTLNPETETTVDVLH